MVFDLISSVSNFDWGKNVVIVGVTKSSSVYIDDDDNNNNNNNNNDNNNIFKYILYTLNFRHDET